jgi:UDP-glucose 4-epimerase
MKIAIIGGAGFIGSHLARTYLNAGHDVFIIDSLINASLKSVDGRARFYQLDIRDNKLQTILQRERPDVVSHHAVQREQQSLPLNEVSLFDADVHIRGLINVLDGCVGASVGKLIFASGGDSLYGHLAHAHAGQIVANEQTPLCPQKPSDISKVAGEWYVRYYTRHFGLVHTILRYANVYGEINSSQMQHPLSYFVHMLLQKRRPIIRGVVEEIHDHIFIDDVVAANLKVLTCGHNQTMHISSGQGCTQHQLYRAIRSLLRSDIEPLYISNTLVEASSCILDNTLARHELKWQPEIDFTLGMQLAVDRLKEHAEAITHVKKEYVEATTHVETVKEVPVRQPNLISVR